MVSSGKVFSLTNVGALRWTQSLPSTSSSMGSAIGAEGIYLFWGTPANGARKLNFKGEVVLDAALSFPYGGKGVVSSSEIIYFPSVKLNKNLEVLARVPQSLGGYLSNIVIDANENLYIASNLENTHVLMALNNDLTKRASLIDSYVCIKKSRNNQRRLPDCVRSGYGQSLRSRIFNSRVKRGYDKMIYIEFVKESEVKSL